MTRELTIVYWDNLTYYIIIELNKNCICAHMEDVKDETRSVAAS